MSSHVAQDSLTAWRDLSARGGLELDDRDSDFAAQLKTFLAPSAVTLEEALRQSSTDQLVRALLDVIHPFSDMFRAILDFFRRAGAREGRDQWQIKINEEHLGLREFESFLESWRQIDAELDVPAIDFSGAWTLFRASRDLSEIDQSTLDFLNDPEDVPTAIADVDAWLHAYGRGDYLPFPSSLLPALVPSALADAAGIAWASNEIVRSVWRNRAQMMADYGKPGFRTGREDGLSPPMIAQNETDYCLGSSVALLGRALKLSPSDLATLGERLAAAFARYPRQRIGFHADVQGLERILSLPVWQRRHELYAVWIATEMVNALGGHECELHHEDGRITFAFRETVVATIHSTVPEKRLIAEKRVPIDQPIGKGRKGNVQPDYGIWTGSAEQEVCGLIVEVKHYKKAARSRFREVLVDYARAHPNGTILLVNHGPVGDMVEGLDDSLKRRCRMLGELTPRNINQRDAFRTVVRDHVGEPVRQIRIGPAGSDTGLLIDISGSMASALGGAGFATLLQSLLADGIGCVALADNQIRNRCVAGEALEGARNAVSGRGTDLIGPIRTLLGEHRRVMVITDADGAANLEILGEMLVGRIETGTDGLWLAELEA